MNCAAGAMNYPLHRSHTGFSRRSRPAFAESHQSRSAAFGGRTGTFICRTGLECCRRCRSRLAARCRFAKTASCHRRKIDSHIDQSRWRCHCRWRWWYSCCQNRKGNCAKYLVFTPSSTKIGPAIFARCAGWHRPFLVSTGVEKVALNFNTPEQQDLDTVTVEQMTQYLNEGHFAPGSMKPKIEAAIKFVTATGNPTVITNPTNLARALAKETGTWIVPMNASIL